MPSRLKPRDQQMIVFAEASCSIGLLAARRAKAHGGRVSLISRNAEL